MHQLVVHVPGNGERHYKVDESKWYYSAGSDTQYVHIQEVFSLCIKSNKRNDETIEHLYLLMYALIRVSSRSVLC